MNLYARALKNITDKYHQHQYQGGNVQHYLENGHWSYYTINAGNSIACQLQNMYLAVMSLGLPAVAALALGRFMVCIMVSRRLS